MVVQGSIALLVAGTYRESRIASGALLRFIRTLEDAGLRVQVFSVTEQPWNAAHFSSALHNRLAVQHVLNSSELVEANEFIAAASGSTISKQPALAQWYKHWKGLKLIEAYEQQESLRFSLISKLRFDVAVEFTSAAAARALISRLLRADDVVLHALGEMFWLGSRSAVGKLLDGLRSGSCASARNGSNRAVRLDPATLLSPTTDLAYLAKHTALPLDAKRLADGLGARAAGGVMANYLRSLGGAVTMPLHALALVPDDAGQRWITATPASYWCYSEGLFVGTTLLHGLSLQAAGSALTVWWPMDWARRLTLPGDFSAPACRHTRHYGVPRLFEHELKLIPQGKHSIDVRANAFRLDATATSNAQLAALLAPTLQRCASPSTAARLWAAGAAAWVQTASASGSASHRGATDSVTGTAEGGGVTGSVTEPIPCRDDFALVAERHLRQTGVAAEVGVFRGDFAALNVKVWSGIYHLIDAWQYRPGDPADKNFVSAAVNEANYASARRAVEPHCSTSGRAPRCVLHRALSVEAAAGFADESLDWLYVDALHTYAAVLADLRAWFPKVRLGGMVSGDDYGDCNATRLMTAARWTQALRGPAFASHGHVIAAAATPPCSNAWGVIRAVNEFAAANDAVLHATWLHDCYKNPAWYFFKVRRHSSDHSALLSTPMPPQ